MGQGTEILYSGGTEPGEWGGSQCTPFASSSAAAPPPPWDPHGAAVERDWTNFVPKRSAFRVRPARGTEKSSAGARVRPSSTSHLLPPRLPGTEPAPWHRGRACAGGGDPYPGGCHQDWVTRRGPGLSQRKGGGGGGLCLLCLGGYWTSGLGQILAGQPPLPGMLVGAPLRAVWGLSPPPPDPSCPQGAQFGQPELGGGGLIPVGLPSW